MSEFECIHRPILASASPLLAERIRLVPLPEGTVLQVFGDDASAAKLSEAAVRIGFLLRGNGPDQWYLVGDEPTSYSALPAVVAGLPDGFSVVDQSNGRIRIAIEGDAVEEVLSKGTGIDLAHFEVGQAATTLIGHVTAHMTRTAIDRFELMPLRSFAESLWEDLRQMAAEYLGAPQ